MTFFCFTIFLHCAFRLRHEVSEKIVQDRLAHFKVDMEQGKLKILKNLNLTF